jgi:hypothetical protein
MHSLTTKALSRHARAVHLGERLTARGPVEQPANDLCVDGARRVDLGRRLR